VDRRIAASAEDAIALVRCARRTFGVARFAASGLQARGDRRAQVVLAHDAAKWG